MGDGEGIVVCVRCRPFNSREKKMNAKLAVQMKGQQTILTDNKGQEKPYTFDYSFWSHDSNDEHFVNNDDVYEKVGKAVLKSAWEGFNSSLFAYGQTGAGKSYSMVGYGEDKGIIPKACDEIFQRIKTETSGELTFKVESSMLEIYNEQVFDLFNPKSKKPGGLKVRDHPKTGVFVENLSSLPVHSYEEISELMEKGSSARTVGSTQMNATSSRAHTIFVINVMQINITKDGDKETKAEKSSKISLIDLAGSERAGDTGATGDRLKEGCAINQSLTALGNVIAALVKKANAKGKKAKGIFIPYRGSSLTYLMKDSLGGNAKTIMIAAISPANVCVEESLSTLKYANRAKQIKNKAVVNEDKQTRMIRELQEEVAQLRKALKAAGGGGLESLVANSEEDEAHKRELEELKRQLMESQSIIANISKTDDEKEKEKVAITTATTQLLEESGGSHTFESLLESDDPFLSNVHADPQMDGRILFPITTEGERMIGRRTKTSKPDISLGGATVSPQHTVIKREGTIVSIIPQENAKTYLNGTLLVKETELKHMDRIMIGQHTYKFIHPIQRRTLSEEEIEQELEIDFVYCQQEFADKQGMSSIVKSGQDEGFEKKMEEMRLKFEREKKMQQEQLLKEKEEMERKKAEMQANFEKLKQEASKADSQQKVDILEKNLAERQKKAEEAFKKQQEELEKKRKKLEEEARKQAELEKRLQLKKKKEQEQRGELEQSLIELIPMVLESNSFSDEMEKNMRFRTKLIAYLKDDGHGKQETHTELGVEVIDIKTNKVVIWNHDKFTTRYYLMQEMYQNFLYALENDEEFSIDEEKDPFHDPQSNEAQIIGISMLYLKSLSHKIDLSIWTPIISSHGEKLGEINAAVIPCTPEGQEITTAFVQDPYTQVDSDEPFIFKVKIKGARGIPIGQSKETYVRFKVTNLENEFQKTKVDPSRSTYPTYDFEKIYTVPKVTKDFIDYMRNSAIKFETYGKENSEISSVGRPNTSRPSTAMRFERSQRDELLAQMSKLSSTSDDMQKDRRQLQRQDSMNMMAQKKMQMQQRTGIDSQIQHSRTIVNITPEGNIELPKLGKPIEGSETCTLM